MPSVLIDRKTKKIISIVEGQKLKNTEEYEVFYTNKTNEGEILKEIGSLGFLGETVHFDVLFKRDSLGDVLMLMPVIAGLKRTYPHLKIALQTDEWLIPLFIDNPVFDSVVDSNSIIIATYEINLQGISDFIALKDGRENQHRTFYYEEVTKDILSPHMDCSFLPDYNFKLPFKESLTMRKRLMSLNGHKVILAPKSKSYFRMWGYRDNLEKNYYKELELIEEFSTWSFIILHSAIINSFSSSNNAWNVTGQTDILECATLCKYADFGIVPDSGIMHLLGVLNIPTIALFGNVTEPEYRISKYKNIFPITTPTTDYDSEKYRKKPYCHIQNCWDGQVHNCIGKEHEKWCTKEITIEKISNVYENDIKKILENSSFILKPYGYKKYTILPSFSNNKKQSSLKYFDEDFITGVKYVGQLGTSGYAIAAKGYIFDMFQQGIPITWSPIDHGTGSEKEDNCIYSLVNRSLIEKRIDYNVLFIHEPPLDWERLFKQHRDFKTKKVIGFTVWETETLPDSWVGAMNSDFIDEIWCHTEYNKIIFKKSGVEKNIRVVPHVWLGKVLPDIEKSKNYVFYNISEFHERKGIVDLLESFCEEFSKDDNVELILKTHYKKYATDGNKYIIEKYNKIINKYDDLPKIKLITKHLTEQEMLDLHAYGDCYYTPCRSEGFGLPIYDAKMYGNNVIATGYGGQVEFLEKEDLIEYELGEVKNMDDFSSLYEDHIWAYPDMKHAKKLLRSNYENWRSKND